MLTSVACMLKWNQTGLAWLLHRDDSGSIPSFLTWFCFSLLLLKTSLCACHSTINGRVGWFLFCATVDNARVRVQMCRYPCSRIWYPLCVCSRVVELGPTAMLFQLLRLPHWIPQWLRQFTFPSTVSYRVCFLCILVAISSHLFPFSKFIISLPFLPFFKLFLSTHMQGVFQNMRVGRSPVKHRFLNILSYESQPHMIKIKSQNSFLMPVSPLKMKWHLKVVLVTFLWRLKMLHILKINYLWFFWDRFSSLTKAEISGSFGNSVMSYDDLLKQTCERMVMFRKNIIWSHR